MSGSHRRFASSVDSDSLAILETKKEKKPEPIKAAAPVVDPLSMLLADPLSGLLNSGPSLPPPSKLAETVSSAVDDDDDKPLVKVSIDTRFDWNVKKAEILSAYEVEGTLKVRSKVQSFLPPN
jgi:hypothetical protein